MESKPTKVQGESENEFEIVFAGENEIDLDSLVGALSNVKESLQQINTSYDSTPPIKVKVRPFKKGSFVASLAVLSDPSISMPLLQQIDSVIKTPQLIIKTFSEIFKLAKFLKGKTPESIKKVKAGNVAFTNESGEVQVVSENCGNTYINHYHGHVTIMNIVANDKEITGMEVKDGKGKDTVQISKVECTEIVRNFKMRNIVDEGPKKRSKLVTDAHLHVVKPVLKDAKTKWNLIYKDVNIPVLISDKSFLKKVGKGKVSFKSGTILVGSMTIEQELNSVANVFENKSYELLKITDVEYPGEQAKFDYDNV